MQFWQPCRKFRVRTTKSFRSKAVNQLKFLFKTFFLQNDPLDIWKQVRTSPQKRCHQKVRKLFAQGLKLAFQLKLLSNQIFIRKLLLRHVDCKFYAPAEKLSTKTNKNRSKSEIDIKSAIRSKKLFSSESGYGKKVVFVGIWLRTPVCSFAYCAGIFPLGVKNNFAQSLKKVEQI